MVDFGKLPLKEFSIVEVLSYFIPGVIVVYTIYIGCYLKHLYPLIVIDNIAVQLFLLAIASYLVGYVLHFPAVLIGRCIKRLVGNPVEYLIDPDDKSTSRFQRKLREDFPIELKKMLRKVILEYWTDSNQMVNISPSQYYTLCEALVEDACPNAWMIHERFYSNSNLSRAMILPSLFLGSVILRYNIVLGAVLFVSSAVLTFRFITLNISSIKQVYSGFYIFYLTTVLEKKKGWNSNS